MIDSFLDFISSVTRQADENHSCITVSVWTNAANVKTDVCKKNKNKTTKKKNRFMEMIRASCLETQSVPLWDWTYSKYVGFRTF